MFGAIFGINLNTIDADATMIAKMSHGAMLPGFFLQSFDTYLARIYLIGYQILKL